MTSHLILLFLCSLLLPLLILCNRVEDIDIAMKIILILVSMILEQVESTLSKAKFNKLIEEAA